MIKRNFKKDLKKIVNNYFKENYENETMVFDLLVEQFGDANLKAGQKNQLKKFMLLFF
jgi:hypothetical protein